MIFLCKKDRWPRVDKNATFPKTAEEHLARARAAETRPTATPTQPGSLKGPTFSSTTGTTVEDNNGGVWLNTNPQPSVFEKKTCAPCSR